MPIDPLTTALNKATRAAGVMLHRTRQALALGGGSTKDATDRFRDEVGDFTRKQIEGDIRRQGSELALTRGKNELAMQIGQHRYNEILSAIKQERGDLKTATDKFSVEQLKAVLQGKELSFDLAQKLDKVVTERNQLALKQLQFGLDRSTLDIKMAKNDLEHSKSLFKQEKDFFKQEQRINRAEHTAAKQDLTLREIKLLAKEEEVKKKNAVFGSNTLKAVIAGAGAIKTLDYGTKQYEKYDLNKTLKSNIGFAKTLHPELKKVAPDTLHTWMKSIQALSPQMAKDPGLSASALQTVHRYGGNIDLATAKVMSEIGDKSKKAKKDKWSKDLSNYALASGILGA